MSNSTQVPYFFLSAYFDIGLLKYLLFCVLMLYFIFILCANVSLIAVICTNRSLQEPMYMFLCSLFVNELYGSTGLFPFLMIQILSDIHTIFAPFCYAQIFTLYTYAQIELCNLAAMSYDRYLAICHPLHYNTRMTNTKAFIFIIFIWLYSFVKFLITLSLSIRLILCGNVINTVFCSNYPIVKLACSDTKVNNIYGIFGIFLSIILPMCLILFSYVKILRVCFLSGSRDMKQKAMNTCTPQLVSLLNFCFGCSFELIQSRFNTSEFPRILKIFLSLYFVILQPLLNPLMFGLQMSKIRSRTYTQICCCKMFRKAIQLEYKCVTKSLTIYVIERVK